MRAWQHRWETWAGWNLGLERWDLLLAQGKPGVFPEATMPCPILRQTYQWQPVARMQRSEIREQLHPRVD
jgi:hypothetical protein